MPRLAGTVLRPHPRPSHPETCSGSFPSLLSRWAWASPAVFPPVPAMVDAPGCTPEPLTPPGRACVRFSVGLKFVWGFVFWFFCFLCLRTLRYLNTLNLPPGDLVRSLIFSLLPGSKSHTRPFGKRDIYFLVWIVSARDTGG